MMLQEIPDEVRRGPIAALVSWCRGKRMPESEILALLGQYVNPKIVRAQLQTVPIEEPVTIAFTDLTRGSGGVLTDDQREDLRLRGIDPTAVEAQIVAIREEKARNRRLRGLALRDYSMSESEAAALRAQGRDPEKVEAAMQASDAGEYATLTQKASRT